MESPAILPELPPEAKMPRGGEHTRGRGVFLVYAIALAVILLVPWSGWPGRRALTFFRDHVNLLDWREDVPFAALLLGMTASIAGLVQGRWSPAVPAFVGGGLFLAAGSMSFGALPCLAGALGDASAVTAPTCAILLCVLAAGMRAARRRPGARLPLRVAAGAGTLLLLLAGLSLLEAWGQGKADLRQAFASACQVPPAFDLWGIPVSHAGAVIVSAALVAAAVGDTGFAWLSRPASPLWAGAAEWPAKAMLLVSPLYALARDLSAPGQPDFELFLRSRWELSSAIFLLLLVDGLGEVMGPASSAGAAAGIPAT
jgi:hypothetical protein